MIHVFSQIDLDPEGPSSISGERATASRPASFFGFLEPIAQYLPTAIEIHGSDHDMGSWLLGNDQRLAALNAIREGRFLTEEELKPLEKRLQRVEIEGLRSACPEDSPAWKAAIAEKNGSSIPGDTLGPTHFVAPLVR